MVEEVFRRVEKKYLLTEKQKNDLIKKTYNNIKANKYFFSKICNIYYDTENYELINKSIDKPIYKEKIRIRSYCIPTLQDNVFIEIKKKFNGIVSKRRVCITLKDLYEYLEKGTLPDVNRQIVKELDYCFKKYNLVPSMYIKYDRYSYCGKDNENFRMTFDTNITYRDYDLQLEKGDYGETLIDEKQYIMEVKVLDSMPIWFTKALSELKVYPISFSKYGTIYKNRLKNKVV